MVKVPKYTLLPLLVITIIFSMPLFFSLANSTATELNSKLDVLDMPMLEYVEDSSALIYFGYVGCLDSCPTAFKNLTKNHNSESSIYFINLIPGLTNSDVQKYLDKWPEAKGIKGIQASNKDLNSIEKYFGNFQAGRIGVYNPIMHTDQVFLIKRDASNNWEIIKRFSSSKIASI